MNTAAVCLVSLAAFTPSPTQSAYPVTYDASFAQLCRPPSSAATLGSKPGARRCRVHPVPIMPPTMGTVAAAANAACALARTSLALATSSASGHCEGGQRLREHSAAPSSWILAAQHLLVLPGIDRHLAEWRCCRAWGATPIAGFSSIPTIVRRLKRVCIATSKP